ncbi:MAG: hypothetical protein JNM52_09065 [Betaproteobacteria bacterium]|nr:hypothetical protein [Betaproteobacteria bacterium]
MSKVFTQEGFRALRWAYGVALAGLGVAGFLVGGSYFYAKLEQENNKQSIKSQMDMRARLENAKRERDDVNNSESLYKAVVARGVFATTTRLDLVEALQVLKDRHKLVALEYEIAPQRVLKLAGGANVSAITVLGSRIKLKIRAHHDGDLLAFLDAFPRLQRGVFPVDRCMMKRSSEVQAVRAAEPAPASRLDDDETPASVAARRLAGTTEVVQPVASLEAECTLEWITLEDKSVKRP